MQRRVRLFSLHALWIGLAIAPCARAITRYVALSGASIPPYTNWAMAAATIQTALDASQDGDTILVSNGVYSTGSRVTPGAILPNRVVITNNVILQSLNGPTNTVIAGDRGTPVRCVYASGNAAIIGFTLTNGTARATGSDKDTWGGGLFFNGASDGLVSNCIVSGNFALNGQGGGISLYNANVCVCDCVIDGNSADGGGGMRLQAGLPTLRNLVLTHNESDGGGGAIHYYHASGTARNLLIAGNSSITQGGGLYFDGSDAELDSVTIAANSAPSGYGGGVMVSYDSSPSLHNCILWDNTTEQIAFNPEWYDIEITLSYSDVQGGEAGIVTHGVGPVNWLAGNTNINPLFEADGSYRLQNLSPCVDVGENMAWMPDATDLAHNPRIVNGLVDMGAFEYGVDRDISIRVSAVDVVWFGYVGETYQVQGAMSLLNPVWENIGSPVAGTGAYMYVMDVTRDTGHRYYRVIEAP
ncbi:MAG TPA: choice-of-anchor Q domain-containing protein [Kiritimatiellia bacterium]|nr:choice-of-anchor Q domain-containing protein [Kiritimatiellia bacterium]HRZ13249.1 choice-of-anchor Q domain-containing protein [Kiritimatiellia bacterium]HSA18698.1 choice-of-anchor Q domain-containing protein [Kiritimatiellia bacterium]